MYYLYLDESGDLGFDFTKQKTSRYFAVSILLIKGNEDNKKIEIAVTRTIKNKLFTSKKDKKESHAYELKGARTDQSVKNYFFERIKDIDFEIYTLILNKTRVRDDLKKNKDYLYNYISRLILNKINLENIKNRFSLAIDRCKNKKGIKDFNSYIERNLKKNIIEGVVIEINHYNSHENRGLQAIDLFSWGIFKKYEKDDADWYNKYKSKIICEEILYP